MDACPTSVSLIDFIERCSVGFLIGIDGGGAPRVGCLSGVAGFAALVDRGTLALRLSSGTFDARAVGSDRVTLLLIDSGQRSHLLLHGAWQQLPAAGVVADVRRRLGIRGRGSRDEIVGILDVEGLRWCLVPAGPVEPDA